MAGGLIRWQTSREQEVWLVIAIVTCWNPKRAPIIIVQFEQNSVRLVNNMAGPVGERLRFCAAAASAANWNQGPYRSQKTE